MERPMVDLRQCELVSEPLFPEVEAFILAGGASSRMGRDKALLEFDGEPLLLRTARLLSPLVSSVTVIAPPERYARLGLHVVTEDGNGMLGGVLKALRLADKPWSLILSCDLPLLTRPVVELLIRRALSSGADIVVPRKVMCAMYHRRCTPLTEAAVARGVHKIHRAMEGLKIDEIQPPEFAALNGHGHLFLNMNCPADYQTARAILESNGRPEEGIVTSSFPH
jgi:molybdopterin-guanine dinucleotide biosynthesis protein A